MTIHVVQSGETVNSIAREYGVSPTRLVFDNGLRNPAELSVGQALVILYPAETYTVQEGDTLYAIARQYGTTVMQLVRNNPMLAAVGVLYPGQTLVIRFTDEKLGSMAINGYAYPYIDHTVLRRTLPYLTYLSIFTYGFDGETGELSEINDGPLIELAREYGVAPVMMIAPMNMEGQFSNELAKKLFRDEALQRAVIANIVDTVERKKYEAVDVDFEYVYPEDRELFVQFVENLKAALSPLGYQVFVALAPKTDAAQAGLLYEGHDYEAMGAVADRVLLMTYEWGYT